MCLVPDVGELGWRNIVICLYGIIVYYIYITKIIFYSIYIRIIECVPYLKIITKSSFVRIYLTCIID